MNAVDTSYDKESLYCEQAIVLKQANFNINTIRKNYQTKTQDNQEIIHTSTQNIGQAKLKCNKQKQDVLFNAVYDLEYQKEFIVAQPVSRAEPKTVQTYHPREGIMGSIPIRFSRTRKSKTQTKTNIKTVPKNSSARKDDNVTIAVEDKENESPSKNIQGMFSHIKNFASSMAKSYNAAINKRVDQEITKTQHDNTHSQTSTAQTKQDHRSDNQYLRGYKVEFDRSSAYGLTSKKTDNLNVENMRQNVAVNFACEE